MNRDDRRPGRSRSGSAPPMPRHRPRRRCRTATCSRARSPRPTIRRVPQRAMFELLCRCHDRGLLSLCRIGGIVEREASTKSGGGFHAERSPRCADHRLRQAGRHRQFDRARARRRRRDGRGVRRRRRPASPTSTTCRATWTPTGPASTASCEAIVKAGGTASATLGDVSVEADAARMVDDVLRRYGRLDILVNNAGAPQGADRNEIEDVPVAAWDLTMGVNARGCLPDVARRGAGDAQGGLGPHRQRVVARGVPARVAKRDRTPRPRRRSSASPSRSRSIWRRSASR